MNNNSLDALFTGLTGAQPTEQAQEEVTKEPKTVPPKDNVPAKSTKQKEERFCTIVSSDLLRKVRIIANREGLQIKDVVNAAFDKAVKSYERKYGVIEGEVRRSAKNLF